MKLYYVQNTFRQKYVVIADSKDKALELAKEHCKKYMEGDWNSLEVTHWEKFTGNQIVSCINWNRLTEWQIIDKHI